MLRGAAHVIAVDASSAPARALPWRPTASPLSLPRKKVQPVRPTQSKAQKAHPREFRDYWWLFGTLHVSRYDARLFEERR